MTKRNRVIALLLAVAVLFVMAFSFFVVAAEAQHDCTGDDCPICEMIAICENNLRGLSFALVCATLMTALAHMLINARVEYSDTIISYTPVSLKVKLLN